MTQKLLSDIKKAANILKELKESQINILTHYDADGLSAAGSLVNWFRNQNTKFLCRVSYDLSEEDITSFLKTKCDAYIFLDLGSGQLDFIKKAKPKDTLAIVLDHHQMKMDPTEIDNLIMVNPEVHGIDGGKEACGSALSALTTYYASDKIETNCLKMGIVGSVGDMQGEGGPDSINQVLFQEAEKSGIMKSRKEFSFFRLREYPVHKAISYSMIPYIPGLSGKEDQAVTLLTSAGFKLKENGKFKKVKDLNDQEKSEIIDKILEYTISVGGNVDSSEFISKIYEFPFETCSFLMEATEFAITLNTCGKMGKQDLGILLASSNRDQDLIDEIINLKQEKRSIVSSQLNLLSGIMKKEGKILILDGRGKIDTKLLGTFSTYYSQSPVYSGNIILVFGEEEKGKIKVSSRAPKEFVDKGLNLGNILNESAKKLGGVGGGHRIAAGATLIGGDEAIRTVVELCLDEVNKIENQI